MKLAQNISRISPTAIYQIGCEALVGTGIKHYERFFKKAIEYRRSLLQFTYEEYPFNPNRFLEDVERQQLREVQISLDKIPKFEDTPFRVFHHLFRSQFGYPASVSIQYGFLYGRVPSFHAL